jgi:hypothetical protein
MPGFQLHRLSRADQGSKFRPIVLKVGLTIFHLNQSMASTDTDITDPDVVIMPTPEVYLACLRQWNRVDGLVPGAWVWNGFQDNTPGLVLG